MQNRIKKIYIFFTLLFFVFFSFYAQNTNKQESLYNIINLLQHRFNIQFNYAEDTIEDFFLIPPSNNLLFKETLEYLETKTGLSFFVMNERIVLIKPKKDIVFCGYIKDKINSEPLVAATIQVSNNSTITDENGFFKIQIENISDLITIRFLGYKNILKTIKEFSSFDCLDIFLSPNIQSLSEVIISNYITSGISKLSDGSFEINFSNFDILPGLIDDDVLQSLQAFPGIQSINETVSNINIRGGTHDQNLILWDGIKMYQSGHFFGLISMYNPHITQTVFLRKNGSDVSYTDGVSGTIAMQTEKDINDSFKGIAEVNLTNLNGFVDVPINDKSSIQIAARKSISDFVETPTYTAFFDRISQNTEVSNNAMTITNSNEIFDFHDTSLRWIYEISDNDEVRLNFINVNNILQFNENATINNQLESRESRLTQNSIAGALHYIRRWNSRLNTELEVYETDYKLKAVNENLLESQRFLQENIVSETSIKLKTNYQLNDSFRFLGGYHFVETEITNLDDVDLPRFRNLVSEVLRTHGLFSQIDYKSLNKKTNLNFGLRYNYIEKFRKSIWEPRLDFSHQFLNYFSLEILGEFKHQNTSQVINFQNDFLGIEKRRWQLSNNRDIPVITSKQISTGINFNKKGWLIDMDVYYKSVNGITTQSQGFQNQYEFVKSKGEYDVGGLDFLVSKQFNKLKTWLSYSYMDNRYYFSELESDYFPSNFNITQTFTLGSALKLNNFKFSAGLNWHSGKPTTLPVMGNEIINNEVNFAKTNALNLHDYMRLDVSAIYNFKFGSHTKANLGVSVWNLLDRENQINNFYRVNNGDVTETIQSSLGITPNAVFRVYF